MVNYNPINLNNREAFYRASRFSESFGLLGYEVTYTPCISYNLNNQGDPSDLKYGEPVKTFVSLVSLNQVTLEKRGWITEDTPIVADLSEILFPQYQKWRDVDNQNPEKIEDFLIPITRYSLLKIPYQLQKLGEVDYAIMDIYGDDTRPMVWECKLAPVRDLTDADPSKPGAQLYRDNTIGKISILNKDGDDTESLEDFKGTNS